MGVWCVGILQAVMFTVVGMSNGKFGIILAPACLTIGTAVAAATYIHIMNNGGADALLEKTGTKDSKFSEKAQEFAQNWGAMGLVFVQINPLTPVPTAVLVVAGMLVRMDEKVLFLTLIIGKFVTLLLNSVVVYFASEGKSLEECLKKMKSDYKEPDKDDNNEEDDGNG